MNVQDYLKCWDEHHRHKYWLDNYLESYRVSDIYAVENYIVMESQPTGINGYCPYLNLPPEIRVGTVGSISRFAALRPEEREFLNELGVTEDDLYTVLIARLTDKYGSAFDFLRYDIPSWAHIFVYVKEAQENDIDGIIINHMLRLKEYAKRYAASGEGCRSSFVSERDYEIIKMFYDAYITDPKTIQTEPSKDT